MDNLLPLTFTGFLPLIFKNLGFRNLNILLLNLCNFQQKFGPYIYKQKIFFFILQLQNNIIFNLIKLMCINMVAQKV